MQRHVHGNSLWDRQAAPPCRFFAILCAIALLVLLVSTFGLAQTANQDRQAQVESLLAAGKLEEVVEICNAWATAEPQAAKPHLLLSDAYAQLKLWDRAQQELDMALQLNPASDTARSKMGDLLRAQGKLDEARQEYEAALKISDRCLGAYVGLARLAVVAEKPDEARPYVAMALQIEPHSGPLVALAGDVERLAGRSAEAEAHYRQALQNAPDCADALYGLAVVLQGQGQEEEAQKLWDDFLRSESTTQRAWLVRNGLVLLAVTEIPSTPAADEMADYSLDGKLLAWTDVGEKSGDKYAGIWVGPEDGSSPPRQVSAGPGLANPRWTPDGQNILFECRYDGAKTQIFISPADGSAEPRELTPEGKIARLVGVLPEGDRVLYCDAWRFWTMKLDGTEPLQQATQCKANVEVTWPRLSRDGKQVIYQSTDWSDKRPGGPLRVIMAVPLDGSTPARPLNDEYDPAIRVGDSRPAFAPDGVRIAFHGDADAARGNWGICCKLLNDPRPPVRICSGSTPVWSPDGTKIAFQKWTRQDPQALFLAHLGGKRLPIPK